MGSWGQGVSIEHSMMRFFLSVFLAGAALADSEPYTIGQVAHGYGHGIITGVDYGHGLVSGYGAIGNRGYAYGVVTGVDYGHGLVSGYGAIGNRGYAGYAGYGGVYGGYRGYYGKREA